LGQADITVATGVHAGEALAETTLPLRFTSADALVLVAVQRREHDFHILGGSDLRFRGLRGTGQQQDREREGERDHVWRMAGIHRAVPSCGRGMAAFNPGTPWPWW